MLSMGLRIARMAGNGKIWQLTISSVEEQDQGQSLKGAGVPKSVILCLAALLLATNALAKTPVTEALPDILQPIGPWRVNNTEAECQLMREFGSGSNGVTLFLAQGAGPGRYDAVFAGTAIPKLPKRLPLALQLTPQGLSQPLEADSAGIPKHDGRFVRWFDADAAFLQNLPTDQQLTLSNNKNFAVTLNLKGIRAAIAALRTCHVSLLQSWGVDTEASKAIAHLPRPDALPGEGNPGIATALLLRAPVGSTEADLKRAAREQLPVIPAGVWVSGNDYPSEALRQEVSGTVTMALTLNAVGRVENCRVVVSSKFEPLDRTSCKVLAERAKYTSARAGNGEAVPATVIERIRWVLP